MRITLHGQRRAAAGRRRLGGREPALRPARAAGPARARRTPASRASAAPAPSTSTACRSAPAWSPPARPQGRDVRTVEGLATGDDLHPVQQAFLEAGAVQCGFCTPGLLVAAHDLLGAAPSPADAEIREALAGNLCRCTGYEKILDAVRLAADRRAMAEVDAMTDHRARRLRSGHRWTPRGRSTPPATSSSRATGSPRSARARPRAIVPARRYVDGTGLPAHARAGQHPPPPLPVGDPRAAQSDATLFEWLTDALPGVGLHRRRDRAARPPAGAWPGWRRTGCTTTTDHHYVFPARRRRRARGRDRARRATSGCASTRPAARWTSGRARAGCRRTTWSRTSTRSWPPPRPRSTATTTRRPDSMVRIGVAPCSPFSVTGDLLQRGGRAGPPQGRPAAHPPAETAGRGRRTAASTSAARRWSTWRASAGSGPTCGSPTPSTSTTRRVAKMAAHRHRRRALPVLQRAARRRHRPGARHCATPASRSAWASTAPPRTRPAR